MKCLLTVVALLFCLQHSLHASVASVSGGNNAAFVMEHAMSLILIGLPLEYYSFDNTDYAVPDYVIGGSRNAVFDGFTPFCGEGHVYRYLSRPGEAADFAGTYEDHGGETHTWSETVNTESGKCFSILVDGGIVRISHTLSIGDFSLPTVGCCRKTPLRTRWLLRM